MGLAGGCIGWWGVVGRQLGCTGLLLVAAAGRGVWGYKKKRRGLLSPALRGRLPTLPLAQYHRRDQV